MPSDLTVRSCSYDSLTDSEIVRLEGGTYFGRPLLGSPGDLVAHVRRAGSLRFFAAIHVLFAHFDRAPPILKVDVGTGSAVFSTFAGGAYWAVSAFFVMAGFVLVYSYAGRAFDTRSFWYRRFARLYPLFLLSLVVLAPLFFVLGIGHTGGW